MDHLETLRCFEGMNESERDQSVDELIELIGAVEGLLQKQTGFDVENLSDYLGRSFAPEEEDDLYTGILRAKRWTFIGSGVTHPRFQELLGEVTTPTQQDRIGAALTGLTAQAA